MPRLRNSPKSPSIINLTPNDSIIWLLSTDRAELKFFPSPDKVPGGYAILSHVWDDYEQTFQDIQSLASRCATLGNINPRDLASPKIRNCCIIAESHGFHWLWADMCCINKENSADVVEAINAMFIYYSLATVCYAFLRDVPGGFSADFYFETTVSPLLNSVWFERGWTLMELLAPKLVIFLSQDWKPIGTKAELANLLNEITRIPVDVLRMQRGIESVSVAQRMCWAAKRKTTRLEDEAYSLMGIFGVNMPIHYGEGRKAFRRLQEEIMKVSADTSLFAWGDAPFEWTAKALSASREGHCTLHSQNPCYLLAESPAAFSDSFNITCKVPHTSPTTVGHIL